MSAERGAARRDRKRRARQETILDTALALIMEGGLSKLTTHALADELDVAVGALYRYFPSKEALIASLERRVIAEFSAELRRVLARSQEAWGAREEPAARLAPLLAVAGAYRSLALTHPERIQLIGRIMAEPERVLPPEESRRVLADLFELLHILKVPFEEAVDAGALAPGDSGRRTILFWSGLRSVLQVYKLEPMAPDVIQADALYDAMVDALLRGWGAAPEAVSLAREWVARASSRRDTSD